MPGLFSLGAKRGYVMFRIYKHISLLLIIISLFSQVALAAPVVTPVKPVKESQSVSMQVTQPIVQNIRYRQTAEKTRIVFDVTALPQYTATLTEKPDQLIIDFFGSIASVAVPKIQFDNQAITNLQISEIESNKQRVVIDLKAPVEYKIFTLSSPNRIVVDILNNRDQKYEEQIAPGVKYTSLSRTTDAGPISAYIVEMTPGADYKIKPVLSNEKIAGLQRVQSMVEHNHGIVGINASYFALSGEILGLLKMNGQIISTSEVDRTVFGMLPDGKVVMDSVAYSAMVTLLDGRSVVITGVNHERGQDDLILYNPYYNSMTGTNTFGSEYTIRDGKVTDITHGNVSIPTDGVVLAAHGTMEKALADLKVGDAVTITETLGEAWDKAIYAIGAGPRLVKNNKLFLTGKEETFPSDITRGRAPRTAVGVTKEGHILLVVVDGRQDHSIGMTLSELAAFMQEWGAVDAMNFDGGGSSEMVVNGAVVNKPSDGRERLVGDALIIAPTT